VAWTGASADWGGGEEEEERLGQGPEPRFVVGWVVRLGLGQRGVGVSVLGVGVSLGLGEVTKVCQLKWLVVAPLSVVLKLAVESFWPYCV
jgi:hypothetical protein